jgi:RNA polymerase sigma-70 factor, ECF subfamily
VGPATADEQAITELWNAHGPALRRFALKLTLGDQQRAEDILQEALLRAWHHPEIVRVGQTAIRPWLFTITRRIAIDMWRSRRRTEEAEEVIDDLHEELPDPAEVIERTVEALDMRTIVGQLSLAHRQVITEMYLNDHSVAETAEILGIPPGTVKSRSYYAMRALRDIVPAPLTTGHAEEKAS